MEQRSGQERRGRDTGPPKGCFDRRRHAERRLPVAEEAALSDDDFAKYFGNVHQSASATNATR
jgi:hypothetical protein